MAVSSISTVSHAAWTYPSANTISPRVEQAAKGRAFEEDTASTDAPKTTSTSEESSGAEAGPKRADGTPMAVPNDPQATIEKMQTVIAAAMAPADPSPTDYQVAAQARQYLLEAKLEASMQLSEMEQARSNGAAATSSADESAANEQPSEEQAA